MKHRRVLISLALSLLLTVSALAGACAKKESVGTGAKPVYPPAIADEAGGGSGGGSSAALDLDETGLFNKINGISAVEPGAEVPYGQRTDVIVSVPVAVPVYENVYVAKTDGDGNPVTVGGNPVYEIKTDGEGNPVRGARVTDAQGNPVYEYKRDANGIVFDFARRTDIVPVYAAETTAERETDADGNPVYDETGAPVYRKAYTPLEAGGSAVLEQAEVPFNPVSTDLMFDPAEVAAARQSTAEALVAADRMRLSSNDYAPETAGVKITGAFTGASFWYSQVIDLAEAEGPLVSLTTGMNGSSYIEEMTFTLTDIYDPARSVSVRVWGGNRHTSFMLVECNGVSAGNNNEAEGAGGGYALHAPRPEYGTILMRTQMANMRWWWPEYLPMQFSYDLEENAVYSRTGHNDGTLGTRPGEYMALDVDDPAQMGGADVCFPGFTTGEVYLKVTFGEMAGENCPVYLYSIGGKDVTAEDIAAAPSNFIRAEMDYDYYKDALPEGAKGVFYPLPTAVEGDICWGGNPIDTALYFGGEDITSAIADGGFVPEETGAYTLLMSSRDIGGFPVFRSWHFTVAENRREIRLDVADISPELYSSVLLPRVSEEGGNGRVDVETVWTHGDKRIYPDENGRYYVAEKGKITVVAAATDYLGGSARLERSFDVAGGSVIELTEGYFPAGLRAGSEFVLPSFEAIDRSSAEDARLDKKVYADTGGGYAPLEGGKLTVPASGSVKIRLVGGEGTDKEVSREYAIPVLDPALSGDASGCFALSGASAEQTEDGVALRFAAGGNAATWMNAVSASNMEISFWYEPSAATYEYLSFSFADSRNSDQSVTLRVTPAAAGPALSVRAADGSFRTAYTLPATGREKITFFYNGAARAVTSSSGQTYAAFAYTDAGNAFAGFGSGGALVSLSAKNGGAITLAKIGNQEISLQYLAAGDRVAPQIALSRTLSASSVWAHGAQFTLPAAAAFDVFQYGASAEVSMTAPSGAAVALPLGASCAEEQTVTLSEYGVYRLSYTAKDALGRTYTGRYTLTVKDTEAPRIRFDGSYAEEYRVGERVEIQGAAVTDNVSAADKINSYALVRDTFGNMTVLAAGEKFAFEVAGVYRFYWYAEDEAGNIAVQEIGQALAW